MCGIGMAPDARQRIVPDTRDRDRRYRARGMVVSDGGGGVGLGSQLVSLASWLANQSISWLVDRRYLTRVRAGSG